MEVEKLEQKLYKIKGASQIKIKFRTSFKP